MLKAETKIVADEFGPAYVVEINLPKSDFGGSLKSDFIKGWLVIDNLNLGPGKGGIRMRPDLTREELWRLARTMTWKNALAQLPFGGAKAGIKADPKKMTEGEKKEIIQAFARRLAPFIPKYYIAGPDMNTGEPEMKWFAEALGFWRASTGKPQDFCQQVKGKMSCGLPHELGSTGLGVATAAQAAAKFTGLSLTGARVAIAGFGNVGSFTAHHLSRLGAKIVAVAEPEATIYDENGLDVARIQELKREKKSLAEYGAATILPLEKVYELPVDILIPAAISDVINQENYQSVKCKIVVEGANIPIPEEIEDRLWKRGLVIVPDFVANAGGVISSWAEYEGLSPAEMFKTVSERVGQMTEQVLAMSLEQKRHPRQVALDLARERVTAAGQKMKPRREFSV